MSPPGKKRAIDAGSTPATADRHAWYKRRAWRQTRQACLARDLYACVRCGAAKGKLDVDHILPVEQWPGKIFDLDNLQTLCVPCGVDKQGEEQIFLQRLDMMMLIERDREVQRFILQQLRRQKYRHFFNDDRGG